MPFTRSKKWNGEISAAHEVLSYLTDLYEDFLLGPEDEEEWEAYHSAQNKRRREELLEKSKRIKDKRNFSMRMRKSITPTSKHFDYKVKVIYDDKQIDPRPSYDMDEDGQQYIETQASGTGNALWIYSWAISEVYDDESPADIYCAIVMNFKNFIDAAQWFRGRWRDSTSVSDYTTYFHYITGSMAGISNANMGNVNRYGFKLYVPDWVEYPYDIHPVTGQKIYNMFPVTAEYDDNLFDDTRTHPVHLPFGFQGCCFSTTETFQPDQGLYGYTAIANPRMIEPFPARKERYGIPLYPDPDNYPGPPGPDRWSEYGLSIGLMDPHDIPEGPDPEPDPEHPGFHRPLNWGGSGMIIDGSYKNEDTGQWEGSLWGVYTGGGTQIDADGCVSMFAGDGLQCYQMMIDHDDPEKVYTPGGLGIDSYNMSNLQSIGDYLDDANQILEVAECLQEIDSLNPCS